VPNKENLPGTNEPTRIIIYHKIIIIAEITSANINISKYFVNDDDHVVVVFVIF
jgi:hypothetical protein